MAGAKFTQNPSPCHSPQPLTAHPTADPVIFFDRSAKPMDLLDTANHRLGAAQRLLALTASGDVESADTRALSVVSEAAYLLLSDGYDLFRALAGD